MEEIDDIDGNSSDPFVAAAIANERELDLSEEQKKNYRKVCLCHPIVDVLAVNIILLVTCYSKINFYTHTHTHTRTKQFGYMYIWFPTPIINHESWWIYSPLW